LSSISILRSEDQLVNSITEKAPSIVILGQDYCAKLAVVNALLGPGQPTLPASLTDSPAGWRMLRIIYGLHNSFSLSLAGNFEVIDHALSRIGGRETLPIDEVLLKVTLNNAVKDPFHNRESVKYNIILFL
jgi:hypothetical protein